MSIETVKLQIVNRSKHNLPAYATALSAGMDLKADIDVPIVLHPSERFLVPTGIYIALPEGYEAQIRPRSGLACKYGVTVANAPGTIDADYRGEVKVCLINLSNEEVTIEPGERIAQLVIARFEKVVFEPVLFEEGLGETERGTGGFGSTGRK